MTQDEETHAAAAVQNVLAQKITEAAWPGQAVGVHLPPVPGPHETCGALAASPLLGAAGGQMTNPPAPATVPRNTHYLESLTVKRYTSGNKEIVEKRRGAEVRPLPLQANFNRG